jgi:hypothetical protein
MDAPMNGRSVRTESHLASAVKSVSARRDHQALAARSVALHYGRGGVGLAIDLFSSMLGLDHLDWTELVEVTALEVDDPAGFHRSAL